jgi:hypothetical protein
MMRLRRTLLSCLVLALVWAQALGMMHRVAHADHAGSGQASTLQQPGDDGQAGEPGHGWIAALFAGHDEGGGSCRVFDQQGHGDAMPCVAALALPSVLFALVAPWRAGYRLAASAAPFGARGPPSSPAFR